MLDVRRFLEGDADVALAKLQRQLVIHDMVHHPEGHLRNACGELAQLDAIELVYIDLAHLGHIQGQLAILTKGLQQVDFEKPQFAVGNNQEVSAATGRVEKSELGELLMERLK